MRSLRGPRGTAGTSGAGGAGTLGGSTGGGTAGSTTARCGGSAGRAAPAGPPPPNHLVGAILSTILCCTPLGIVSIVYAAQVNSKWQVGDFAGANEASSKAATWMWWAVGSWVVVMGLYVIIGIAASA